MVNISLTTTETNEFIKFPLYKVIGKISGFMDNINIDESQMELVTDKFTFTLSAKRNKDSIVADT